GYSTALEQVLKLPTVAADFRVAGGATCDTIAWCSVPRVVPCMHADSLGPLYYAQSALFNLIGCSSPWVPRSAGSPADFAAAMTSMTSGLRAVRDSLGAAAFREQLWGTTGFVPPTQPPPPTPPSPSPPLAGGPALSTPLLATVIAVPVGVCSLLMVLLTVIITHLRRNAKLQRSLLGHVLPPAAGDKATLVITDVQGSSKLWETLPAGVMEASMKVHDELVRRLALDSSGYEWATEGDSFLLCFHTPQAAVAFAIQLQDALLQCSQWPAQLMAAGSPSQHLYLTSLGLRPQTNTSPGSFSDAGTSVTTIPAYAASLLPCVPPSKMQAVVPEPPGLFSGPSELSLTFMTKTAPVMEAAGPASHSGTQQRNPVFVPMTAEPLPQGLPPAALPGMSAKALLAAKTPVKRATKSAGLMGLLSLSVNAQATAAFRPALDAGTDNKVSSITCGRPRPTSNERRRRDSTTITD
ncbi:guanylate cyclase domain-containing protein, partial [Haematococcus lacustris]